MHPKHIIFSVLLFALLLLGGTAAVAQQTIGTPAFQRVWNEQDGPVADGRTRERSWTWGPAPISPVLEEPMQESPGGTRQVQYFDKSRMEINDPDGNPNDPWYVTNGLLPIEMMTGRIQVGYASFVETEPARVSAVGDPDTYPTYADLGALYESPGTVGPDEIGWPVTRLLRSDGSRGDLLDYQDDPATRLEEGPNGHGVPRGFLEFQNTQGMVYRNGQAVQGQVYFPKFVFGLPVTKAYWVNSRVGGKEMPILFQVFERRVLTYNPANPPGARVEMGNVGQHFYRWRYESGELPEVTAEPEDPYPYPVTEEPTATPSATVTEAPAEEPTATPSATVTEAPAEEPTATPSATPTEPPAEEPTNDYPEPGTCLAPEEAELARLINAYRNENGLPDVPVSKSLAQVAQTHVIDLHENEPDSGTDSRGMACNMHSWSDKGNWSAVCYTRDHEYAEGVWNKPREITNNLYTGNGYENAYGSSGQATASGALTSWQNSHGHNALILELDNWDEWQAMGVGIYEHHAVLWFGREADPQGTISACE